jgi:hypothetical protein
MAALVGDPPESLSRNMSHSITMRQEEKRMARWQTLSDARPKRKRAMKRFS